MERGLMVALFSLIGPGPAPVVIQKKIKFLHHKLLNTIWWISFFSTNNPYGSFGLNI